MFWQIDVLKDGRYRLLSTVGEDHVVALRAQPMHPFNLLCRWPLTFRLFQLQPHAVVDAARQIEGHIRVAFLLPFRLHFPRCGFGALAAVRRRMQQVVDLRVLTLEKVKDNDLLVVFLIAFAEIGIFGQRGQRYGVGRRLLNRSQSQKGIGFILALFPGRAGSAKCFKLVFGESEHGLLQIRRVTPVFARLRGLLFAMPGRAVSITIDAGTDRLLAIMAFACIRPAVGPSLLANALDRQLFDCLLQIGTQIDFIRIIRHLTPSLAQVARSPQAGHWIKGIAVIFRRFQLLPATLAVVVPRKVSVTIWNVPNTHTLYLVRCGDRIKKTPIIGVLDIH
nr:MAG TPA: hypothetical protein [Bacteriophage sp.]